MNPARSRVFRRALMCAAAAGLAATLAGCVGYGTYPRAEGEVPVNVANSAAADELIIASLDWVTRRYPVPGEIAGPADAYAVNLPGTMRYGRALKIVEKLGPPARDLTSETLDLPRYSIGRIWIRTDRAEVDVYRPALAVTPDGRESATQMITVRLAGGLQAWRVESTRPWAVGAFDEPVPSLRDAPPSPWEGYDDRGNRLPPFEYEDDSYNEWPVESDPMASPDA